MTYTEITDLISKGFTPDQITELARQQPEPDLGPDPGPEPEPDQEPEQEPEPEPDQEPEQEPQPEQPTVDLSGIQSELADLKKLVQKNNILTKTIETPSNDSDSVENILAGLIRPAINENGGK